MSEYIQTGVERLSICPDDTEHPKKSETKLKKERWVYGFHFKHRVIHNVARKLGLPWETDPCNVLDDVEDHIEDISGVPYQITSVYRRGRCCLILTFAEDDGRKRAEKNKFSPQAMDRVRSAMMLPKGTQPKWYESTGRKQDEGTELSSDDEEWPNNRILTRTENTIESLGHEDEPSSQHGG